jgi:NMD protein affecting ribosome stability and mRNA decay
MNCAWCGANDDDSDSHGICDDCMVLHFSVDPVSIREVTGGEEQEDDVRAA